MSLSDEESDICTQDETTVVQEMVKGILILDHSKKPFKQSELMQFLSKKPNRSRMEDLLLKSRVKLEEMGLILIDVKNSSPKSYILTSNLSPLPSMYQAASHKEVADRTLLVLVLTFIFVKEGTVKDTAILQHLGTLNIYSEGNPVHDYFGDIKKKIFNEFVSQLYLKKIEDKELETCEIKWGERAIAEVTKMSILEFICNIGYKKKIKPKDLPLLYNAALEGSQKEMTVDN